MIVFLVLDPHGCLVSSLVQAIEKNSHFHTTVSGVAMDLDSSARKAIREDADVRRCGFKGRRECAAFSETGSAARLSIKSVPPRKRDKKYLSVSFCL